MLYEVITQHALEKHFGLAQSRKQVGRQGGSLDLKRARKASKETRVGRTNETAIGILLTDLRSQLKAHQSCEKESQENGQ